MEERSLRVEFSLKTKKLLAERAGLLCSHFDCLRPTVAPAKNRKGNDAAVGTGVAAHIYAASENGPRPPTGMTEAEIKDPSNGTWMCKLCADQIDDFRHEYPAERIFKMKRVREFAQHFSVTQSDAAYIVGWMGVKRLDLLVRDHFPDLDPEKIRRAVVELGRHFIGEHLLPDRSAAHAPPSTFIKKSLPAIMREAEREEWKAPSIPKAIIENRWALEIARVFNAEAYKAQNYDLLLTGNSQVCLSSRSPRTGALSDVKVLARATLFCHHNPNLPNGDNVFLLVTSSDGTYWTYEQSNGPEGLSISSLLQLGTYPLAQSAEHAAHPNRVREEFERYATWIDDLCAGNYPVGQIGLRRTDWPTKENLHHGIFDIQMNVQPDRLQKIRGRCARVRMAYKIAEQWDVEFFLNDNFLEPFLPLDDIREAVEILMKANPGYGRAQSAPLLVLPDGQNELVLNYSARKVALSKRRVFQMQ